GSLATKKKVPSMFIEREKQRRLIIERDYKRQIPGTQTHCCSKVGKQKSSLLSVDSLERCGSLSWQEFSPTCCLQTPPKAKTLFLVVFASPTFSYSSHSYPINHENVHH